MPKINVKDKRKQQLMDAATASIAKHGITETTITTVSQAAQMSRGIINFYFTSKEKMMQDTCKALVNGYQEVWQEAEKAAEGKSPLERIEAVIQALFTQGLCSARRLTVLSAFWGHASAHADYRKIIAKGNHALVETFAVLLQQASGKDAAQAATSLLALVHGCWLALLLAPDTANRKDMAEQCLAFVRKFCAADPPKKSAAKPAATKTPPAKKLPEKPPEQLDFGDLFGMKR